MPDFQPIPDEDNIWLRKKRPRQARAPSEDSPWGTWICCLLCAAIFILIHATAGSNGENALAYALYPSPYEIWGGAFWGPLTCSFTHFDFMHAAFNIYWLFLFGKAVERHFGTIVMLALAVSGGILSLSFQLAFTDAGAIGASGINYTLFGFLWIARRKIHELEELLPDRLVRFFLFWLVLCFFLTKAGLWPVANAAHTSGLIFGCLVAAVFVVRERRALTIPALVIASIMFITPFFYAPWSSSWNWSKGYALLEKEKFEKALPHYEFVLRDNPQDEEARNNLDLARSRLGLVPDKRWPPRDED